MFTERMKKHFETLRKRNASWKKPSTLIFFVIFWTICGAAIWFIQLQTEKRIEYPGAPFSESMIVLNAVAAYFISCVLGASIGLYLVKRFSWTTHDLIVELYDEIETLKQTRREPVDADNQITRP
jgi:predicted permease